MSTEPSSLSRLRPVNESVEVSRTEVAVASEADRVTVRTHATSDPTLPGLRPRLLSTGLHSARVALVPDGAMLLAGDHISLAVDVGEGTDLELVEPGGTVAYDMRGGSAVWDVQVRLGRGASLTWHGLPFVASTGAQVRRTLSVVLGQEASLLLRETLVLGRTGETGGRVDNRSSVSGPSGPVLVERLDLGPEAQVPGILGRSRVVDTITAVGVPLPPAPVPASSDASAPASSPMEPFVLEGGGLLWRGLATEAHATGLDAVWRSLTR